MEDLGEYIYWIFIGIAVVSSFFGKKKKKDIQPTEYPVPDWKKIHQKISEGEEDKHLEPVAVKTRKAGSNEQPVEAMVSKVSAAEGVRSVKHKVVTVENDEESESAFSIDMDDTDELAKGIIYSEILTRKY
ncbi:MAG TPA: hypothetical protein PLJ40_02255 [Paludibacteraceae bacterium]|nr:hypothetical protein [Paludibacteraceae bacterium]HQB69042.1 hypothetical protein [Paludibacteraceae bacterium]HRS67368.1 hypothetical protein [Paludibacteraceae bacterium]